MRSLLSPLVALLVLSPVAVAADQPSERAVRLVAERRDGLEELNAHLRLLTTLKKPIDDATQARVDRAVKALHDALASADPHVRSEVVNDVLNVYYGGFPADAVIAEILPLIRTPETELEPARQQGVLMDHLGHRYAEKARDAVPLLVRMMNDSKAMDYLRGRATEALGRIGKSDPDVLKAFLAVAKDPKGDPAVVGQVVQILGDRGDKSAAVRELLAAICRREPNKQHHTFLALGQVSMDDPPKPLETYLEKLRTPDAHPLGEAAAAFLHVQKYGNPESAFREPNTFAPPTTKIVEENAKASRPVLLGIVKSRPDDLFSRMALRVLEAIGPGSSKEAAEVLAKVVLRPADYADAVYALAKFDAADPAAVPVFHETFREVTRQNSWYKQVELAKLLARYGKHAAPAAPTLIDALKGVRITDNVHDAYFQTYAQFCDTLAAIGGETPTVREAVLDLLSPESKALAASGKAANHYRAKLFETLAGVGLPKEGDLRAVALQHVTVALLMDIDIVFPAAAPVVIRHGAALSDEEAAKLLPAVTRVLAPGFRFGDADGKVKEEPKDPFLRFPMTEQTLSLRALAALGPRAKDALPILQALADRTPDKKVSDFTPPPPVNDVIKEAKAAVAAIKKKS